MRIFALAILLGLATPLAAQAADPGFCGDYARAALRQTRLGYAAPYCAPGMRGARWSGDFNVHYHWCLGAPYDAASREREIRREYLVRCRGSY